ncbi:tRNA (adenosine(37)-N6)-threonylcarbamoyltransferase complex dimerization subunit type 1 TsaB [Solibaculum mannosilyticum]|uniref:tRNA (adenosine(37)-N6)-threonylcarbamoyltransferase complex dimerization subunit type 1 TsaB n=1 Tax=Solibaculum mannosilyticum TaxID=2780922 RepID=UPI0007A7EAD8|nr:tRNA threonylcarbamoyladenosine biosynthesis protein TsaB [Eubacteriaceae bacterium CHKCI005]
MRILAIDSTAVSASCALMEEQKLTAEFYMNCGLTHSETLMPMINDVLRYTGTTPQEIDYLAVAAGPGSFTGVRIGVAAIKGMALALDLPCVGVSTLEAMAWNLVGREKTTVCAVMDARCKQVYQAFFEVDETSVTRRCEDRAISIEQLGQEIVKANEPVMLVGDGAQLCMQELMDTGLVQLAPLAIRYQRASGVAQAAEKEIHLGNILNGDQLRPVYLRLPQAERELKKKIQSGGDPV